MAVSGKALGRQADELARSQILGRGASLLPDYHRQGYRAWEPAVRPRPAPGSIRPAEEMQVACLSRLRPSRAGRETGADPVASALHQPGNGLQMQPTILPRRRCTCFVQPGSPPCLSKPASSRSPAPACCSASRSGAWCSAVCSATSFRLPFRCALALRALDLQPVHSTVGSSVPGPTRAEWKGDAHAEG